MRKLLPVLIVLLGTGLGASLGWMLRPVPEIAAADAHGDGDATGETAADAEPPAEVPKEGDVDYVRLNNQFVVPVLHDGKVASLVVLSLSLEVQAGQREFVYTLEPKLRDVFLTVLFEHANAGGFDGTFTESRTMRLLREALTEAARRIVGAALFDVLVIDIVRQDMG